LVVDDCKEYLLVDFGVCGRVAVPGREVNVGSVEENEGLVPFAIAISFCGGGLMPKSIICTFGNILSRTFRV